MISHADVVGLPVARAVYADVKESDVEWSEWPVPRVLVLVAASYFGNWRMAALEDDEDYIASRRPLDDAEWWP